MNTATLPSTSPESNSETDKNDLFANAHNEYGRMGDLFDMNHATSIALSSSGLQILRTWFATEKFADNQVVMLSRLENGDFQIFSYIGDIHAAMSKANLLPADLSIETVSTPSAIPGKRLSALSKILIPDKTMKVYFTLNYFREYFKLPISKSQEQIGDSRGQIQGALN